MAGERIGKADAEYRKKRVKRIKKIIVTTCIILLILPTVISIFLMIKVFRLQAQMNLLVAQKQEMSSNVVQARGKNADSATAAQTARPSANAGTAGTRAAVEEDVKRVYLTFDDGPGTQTAKILDILKKEKVKATFFVTGKEDEYAKKMYRRIVKEGHTLGMHSYSHIYSDIYSSKKEFTRDLKSIYNLLKKTTGEPPKYYRFPGGSSYTETDVPIDDLIPVLEKMGIVYLDWNVISPDTVHASVSKTEMIDGILEGVAAYDTSIVLLYDVADRPMTVKALPEIIKQLKKQNYELLPVDEATAPIRHNS